MIAEIGFRIRKLRNWFNRSYWAIRLLHLSKSEGTATAPGLVLVQIDGLSLTQYHRGLREGNLPFLLSLIRKQKYKEHAHYSGVPSTTPAVQGELFYGVKACVPAFNFIDQASGEILVMFDPKAAGEIENRLNKEKENVPLLKGGSSYSNIFAGGAGESHFCAVDIGWQGFFKMLNPFSWLLIFIFHFNIFIRTVFLLLLEIVIGFYDAFRGIVAGEKFFSEMPFILARVLICVLLRELTIIGAKIDIARGLPVIHLNLFGYDEQSHRRGPSSKFAHWSLRGIDDGIARIWRATRFADRRDYDVWIYSDHGQEDTLPYIEEHGKTIQEVVSGIFGELADSNIKKNRMNRETISCCGNRFSEPFLRFSPATVLEVTKPKVVVTGMGPLGHIYPCEELSPQENERVISELLMTAKVPVVFIPKEAGKAEARTLTGKFMLPEEASGILGEDHPFLKEAARDLVDLCHHPDAGKIIMGSWCKGKKPRTFPRENGSHAGYGAEETNGFALLPSDAPLSLRSASYLRPLDIREAALRHLGKTPRVRREPQPRPTQTLRIMTYNVHGCVGMDGKLSPDRIARLIGRQDVDVVALQELDVGRTRSGRVDQAEVIAQKLEMGFHFYPSRDLKDGKYGNAILSRYPMRLIRMDALPRFRIQRIFEPRGALWAEIDIQGVKMNLVTSHLSLWPRERLLQTEALLGSDWIGSESCRGPVILCGDFNADPRSMVCKRVACKLRDAQLVLESHKPQSTWWLMRHSLGRIDHVFVSPDVDVMNISVPRTALDQIASDHLPLIVDLKVGSNRDSEKAGK